MSRKQYRGFIWQQHRGEKGGDVWAPARRFTAAWDLDGVSPLFKVPACVLFAEQGEIPTELPTTATAFAGRLSEFDVSLERAAEGLERHGIPWPRPDLEMQSAYAGRFRQGATVVPRRFFLVVREATGKFGGNPDKPVVSGRTSALDKEPWKSLRPPRGSMERKFLRRLYLGESIAPFRLLAPAEAIIPWTAKEGLLDAKAAQTLGYLELADWLRTTEALWRKHAKSEFSLMERLDFQHELTSQLPSTKLRVLYAKAGIQPAAAILRDDKAVVDHKLYWASVGSDSEARYLEVVMNSEALRRRVAPKQSRGQWGARDFDKALVEAIPEFDATNQIHTDLVREAGHAEQVAGEVELPEGAHFTRARRKIREALREDGVAGRIDKLVEQLLGR